MPKTVQIDKLKIFTLQAKLDKEHTNKLNAIKKHYNTNNTDTTIRMIDNEYNRLNLAPQNSEAELHHDQFIKEDK